MKIGRSFDLQLRQNFSPIFHWAQAVSTWYSDRSHWLHIGLRLVLHISVVNISAVIYIFLYLINLLTFFTTAAFVRLSNLMNTVNLCNLTNPAVCALKMEEHQLAMHTTGPRPCPFGCGQQVNDSFS